MAKMIKEYHPGGIAIKHYGALTMDECKAIVQGPLEIHNESGVALVCNAHAKCNNYAECFQLGFDRFAGTVIAGRLAPNGLIPVDEREIKALEGFILFS